MTEEDTRKAFEVLEHLAGKATGKEREALLLAGARVWEEHVRLLYGEHEEQP